MIIGFDTLKCAKLLENHGFNKGNAETLVTVLSLIEITNLYSTREIDVMLSELVDKVFQEEAAKRKQLATESEKHLSLLTQESDKRLSLIERQFNDSVRRLSDDARQLRYTVITVTASVGVAVAGYLTALIHYVH